MFGLEMADRSGRASSSSSSSSSSVGGGGGAPTWPASLDLALFSRLFKPARHLSCRPDIASNRLPCIMGHKVSASSPDSPTIAIIGAGLTGLLAAHGLYKNGFNAVVFDRDPGPDARERDWTMLMHWALPMLEELLPEDIVGDLPQAFCNPHLEFNEEVESLPCYNALTGDMLFRSPTPGARRVSRQALRRLFTRGVDIRWNKALSRLSKTEDGMGVILEFEDGHRFEAERVLGADGVSSKTRALLAGAERARPQRSGFLFATGITRYGDAEKTEAILQTHPVAALVMGTSSVGAVGTMAVDDPQDKSTWTTFWVKIWRGKPVHLRDQEALDYIGRETRALSGVFQSAIDWTPEGSRVFIDEMKYWVPVSWDNLGGRATLAGDAAHPMLICEFSCTRPGGRAR
ncbi:hypothetical protein JDV02_000627 [Purpureocillium takamizusanense]|uniref:FAD-binding domain-containing protein n=1 Tax=Purpureocillium takamizusanense TaxID=2060973 RepID=A0A9Q8V6L0_9HYPO|nr:uncharacterized protein JDV02_000627 [Purpureocillium takamizusanense]UNI13939.1 hypothetical protein JDV02_000627 [Purpureocillium takamizusanense]